MESSGITRDSLPAHTPTYITYIHTCIPLLGLALGPDPNSRSARRVLLFSFLFFSFIISWTSCSSASRTAAVTYSIHIPMWLSHAHILYYRMDGQGVLAKNVLHGASRIGPLWSTFFSGTLLLPLSFLGRCWYLPTFQ